RDLRNGQEKDPKTDGGAQREQYLAAIEKANQAYDEAVQKAKERWLVVIGKYEADLDELNAALYVPEYNARSRELLRELREEIESGDNDNALALYQSTIPNVDAVVAALTANLDWLDQLRQEVTGLMGEAGRQDLGGEAAKLEKQGRSAYDSAMGHRLRGDMQSMEQDLFDARYYLRQALRRSGALDPSNVDKMLRSVQQRLEAASQRTIVDEDGSEIMVEPWRGDLYLEEHPLVDLNQKEDLGPRRRDESELQQPQVSEDFLPARELSSGAMFSLPRDPSFGKRAFRADWQLRAVTQRISEVPDDEDRLDQPNSREGNPFEDSGESEEISNEEVSRNRLGDEESGETESHENLETPEQNEQNEQEMNADNDAERAEPELSSGKTNNDAELLLQQAINSWQNGVAARNKGSLLKAQHYFEEASRLVDQYNVQYAILGYYTVRKLKPEDCLWRIAGYSDIYGDPFQWTRIYQRNRHLISNPSLIYPGQRFVIPPARD
ncbi:MAG: hypothetical protein AAF975_04265, partial [Spirochaetota bacterium]